MKSLIHSKTLFRRKLLAWYRREARDLPWRDAADPYIIWVTEIMLQQTRVEQGTPYIQRFIKAFPTVQNLARAKEERVLKLWEGLGYYTRARNLHKAAKFIVHERNGQLPETADEWKTLPGVGPYTAGAIASIAFGEETPVVDGNVKRVMARLTDYNRNIDTPKSQRYIWSLMGKLVIGKSPGDFNQAVMELGARICLPRNPACQDCPVMDYCKACERSTQHKRPVKARKKKIPHYQIVVAAIRKNGRYLMGRRPSKGMLGGLWEFPGGKIESGETPEAALIREIKEELNVKIKVGEAAAQVNHAYSHFKITLTVYHCTHVSGKPSANVHTELKWVLPRDFGKYPIPKANHKFMHLLR